MILRIKFSDRWVLSADGRQRNKMDGQISSKWQVINVATGSSANSISNTRGADPFSPRKKLIR